MSVDPAHDTPQVLTRYGKLFGQDPTRWTMLTGKPDVVLALERRLGVDVAPRKDGEVAHTESLVFIGPDGRIADRLGGSAWTPGEVLARARAVAGLPASPFEGFRLALARGVESVCGGGVSGISLGVALLIFAGLCVAFGLAASRAILSNVRR